MSPSLIIRKAEGTWSVRAGGAVLGETTQALELTEGDLPPVIYFPRDDIAMAFLDPSDKTTQCPHKGTASYYSVVTKNRTLHDAVWSYQDPVRAVARIAGHLAFDRSADITVEQI